MHLSSKDVIHSFGLFEMRREAGRHSRAWTSRSGSSRTQHRRDYEIACSQLCGLGHYRMRGFVSVKSQGDYDAWLASEEKAPDGAVA